MASSCRRRTNSRWLLLHPFVDVVADPLLQLDLAEHLARPGDRLLSRALDVDVSSSSSFSGTEVGREAGRVGQRTRLLDGPQEGDHAAAVASLEDGLDDGAVGAHLLGQFVGDLGRVGPLGDVDPERAAGCVGTTQLGAVQRPQRDPRWPPGRRTGSPSTSATTPTRANRPSILGTSTTWPSGPTSSTATLASGDASSNTKAIPGRTMPSSSGIGERPGIRHESAFD